ncbi:MAG: hypothetical protein PHS59_04875 [Paludibacter sp.]|nr:hypothetical protein [Paludibacter sp.]
MPKIIIAFLLLTLSLNLFAELPEKPDAVTGSTKLYKTDSLHKYINIPKVPKQYSFELGYRNIFSVIDNANALMGNSATHGYGFLFDYAWQLSGLNKKRPAVYLSVPMGYTVVFADNNLSKNISLLNYGWTVRHELAENKSSVPFLGYGLLLNTLKVNGTPGGVMGHQTQFEFGYNFNAKSKVKYIAKIQYSYASFPKLGVKERLHFQFADLRVGVRF